MTGAGAPGPDLAGREAEELLRPAAELAIELARDGLRQQPPLEVPSRLRPLLGHAKVTKAALATARRVVEEDQAFRFRLAAAVEGAGPALGRAGVLWLCRPEGWEAELGALVAATRSAAAARSEDAEERSARRRLRHAEEARGRAELAAETSGRVAESARAEVQEERRLRRAAEAAAERADRRAASLEEQLTATRRAAAAAAGRLAERTAASEAALAVTREEGLHLRAEVAGLRDAMEERAAEDAAAGAPPEPEQRVELDRLALVEAVAAASSAAAALGEALARAAAVIRNPAAEDGARPAGPGGPPSTPSTPSGAPARTPPRPTPARRDRTRPVGPSRRPAALPPFVLEDSVEAAAYLVALPGVTLLVDGYNATLSTWPGLPLPEQRIRLVDALTELAARTGARPEVVFDGAEAAGGPMPGRARQLVRVTFTDPEIEADDVLIERAGQVALPVVVASDDRRVRVGAAAAGANVLGVEQLLAALRRTS